MMAERGIILSHESIRQWCLKFGEEYSRKLRRKRGQAGDKWHVDEVFIKINGTDSLPLASGRSERHGVRYFGHQTAK